MNIPLFLLLSYLFCGVCVALVSHTRFSWGPWWLWLPTALFHLLLWPTFTVYGTWADRFWSKP